ALLRPFRGGAVSHNGVVLYREAVLKPGDLIGLGSHFVFLYRDPRVTPAPPLALALPLQTDGMTSFGPGNMMDRQEALRKYLGSNEAVLKFQANHADILLQEIISKNSTPDAGGGPLAPAYLLSLMIDYASKHLDPALTPQLLLKAANQIKAIVWVR
ncbi:ras-interacting protein 1, partial [Silurus asotus]